MALDRSDASLRISDVLAVHFTGVCAMTHDNPYDQRESDWAAEDLRQRRADEADEAFNECRQLEDDEFPAYQDDDEMTVGLDCCPHLVPYGSDCDDCDDEDPDAAYEPSDPKRSDFLDGED